LINVTTARSTTTALGADRLPGVTVEVGTVFVDDDSFDASLPLDGFLLDDGVSFVDGVFSFVKSFFAVDGAATSLLPGVLVTGALVAGVLVAGGVTLFGVDVLAPGAVGVLPPELWLSASVATAANAASMTSSKIFLVTVFSHS
jgi:hypothetical protein